MRYCLVMTAVGLLLLSPPLLATDTPSVPAQKWSFQGATGTFDRGSLQRGFQVYREVCSVCHGLKRIRFRELQALGFNEEEIKALASSYEIADIGEEGEDKMRKGLPSDAFPNPFKNDAAARAANNGALPPDLSLMVKARAGEADYLFALLTGFDTPPAGQKILDGMYYNAVFPGNQIAMAPPFVEGQVTYADGTLATIPQMAHDVTTFLAWAASPDMESRKAMGWRVLTFVLVFTSLMGFLMRRIWRQVGPSKEREIK